MSNSLSRRLSPLCAKYKVTLHIPDEKSNLPGHREQTFECKDDQFILDAAEENGIDLPSSCRAGSCASCTGLLKTGTVDQDDQSTLSEEQVGLGYVLTCVAYPTSDVTILTSQEDNLP